MSPLITIFLFQLILLLIENLGAQTINDLVCTYTALRHLVTNA